MTTAKLSKSQERNLENLRQLPNGVDRVISWTVAERRVRYTTGTRVGISTRMNETTSHKGFHIVALDSLVAKGLVVRTFKETGDRRVSDPDCERGEWYKIGAHSTWTYNYRVA